MYPRHTANPALAKIAFYPSVDGWMVRKGFARRPRCGDAMGSITIFEFKKQIWEWLLIGNADPSKKMSANRMLKLIQIMNPDR